MKKTFLAALAALMLSISAQAQQSDQAVRSQKNHAAVEQKQGQMRQFDAQQLALKKAQVCRQELRLDDKQYDKVFKAYRQFFQEVEKLRAGEGEKQDAKKLQDAKMRLSKQMQKLLTDVQFAEWQQLDHRPHHKAKGGPAHRGDAVRHPAQGQMHKGMPGRGGRNEMKPDSVEGFRGNSRKPMQQPM